MQADFVRKYAMSACLFFLFSPKIFLKYTLPLSNKRKAENETTIWENKYEIKT